MKFDPDSSPELTLYHGHPQVVECSVDCLIAHCLSHFTSLAQCLMSEVHGHGRGSRVHGHARGRRVPAGDGYGRGSSPVVLRGHARGGKSGSRAWVWASTTRARRARLPSLGLFIGSGLSLPEHFSPIYFPMGNAATGFFVIFAVIAGVVGAAAALAGFHHVRVWTQDSLPAAASSGFMAWALTVVAMGLAIKEIDLRGRNARYITMEAFTIILSVTQLFYLLAIQGGR